MSSIGTFKLFVIRGFISAALRIQVQSMWTDQWDIT